MDGGGMGDGGPESEAPFDDSAFYVFAAAMLLLYWVPTASLRLSRRLRGVDPPHAKFLPSRYCKCSLCQAKAAKLQSTRARPSQIYLTPSNITFVVATVLLVASVGVVYKANLASQAPFDPFEILGVPHSASKREIERAYRVLASTMHPDKNKDNPNAADDFMRIASAKKALTDEEAKANYIKYGNPDGYQGTKLGVGLPRGMLAHSNLVLLAYFLLLGVAFPAVVIMWWRRRSQMLSDSVMTMTYALFRDVLAHSGQHEDLLNAVACAFDLQPLFKEGNSQLVVPVLAQLRSMAAFDLSRCKFPGPPPDWMVHNVILLHAHVARVPIPDEVFYVMSGFLSRFEALCTAMADSVAMLGRADLRRGPYSMSLSGFTSRLLTVVRVGQRVYHAMEVHDSPLLQVPHFSLAEVRACTQARPPVTSVYALAEVGGERRAELLPDMTPEQRLDVDEFCTRYPKATLTVSKPTVDVDDGDEAVHQGDTVTVSVCLTVTRAAGDLNSPCLPLLPEPKSEVWWIVLSDADRDLPLGVRRLQPEQAKPVTVDEADATSSGVSVQFETKFMMVAPVAARYHLVVHAVPDCYVGADVTSSMRMDVLEPKLVADDTVYFDPSDESDVASVTTSESFTDDGEYNSEDWTTVTDSSDDEGHGHEDENGDDGHGHGHGSCCGGHSNAPPEPPRRSKPRKAKKAASSREDVSGGAPAVQAPAPAAAPRAAPAARQAARPVAARAATPPVVVRPIARGPTVEAVRAAAAAPSRPRAPVAAVAAGAAAAAAAATAAATTPAPVRDRGGHA
eukprot:TRINITY_DN792_c0_g1_i8.p1 TRINITY_DN792_c0_g1~~TRINITY_DN792_c0_g1_i8.p1  ORF type:complete len:792 (+),score=249.62 TRINITY_DN792_c0_g1_i8:462-2837(+)